MLLKGGGQTVRGRLTRCVVVVGMILCQLFRVQEGRESRPATREKLPNISWVTRVRKAAAQTRRGNLDGKTDGVCGSLNFACRLAGEAAFDETVSEEVLGSATNPSQHSDSRPEVRSRCGMSTLIEKGARGSQGGLFTMLNAGTTRLATVAEWASPRASRRCDEAGAGGNRQ